MRSYTFDARLTGAPIRVLLVDDDENSFILTRRLLSKASGNYAVEWAADFEQGLEVVGRRQHDVYLFDYRLGARNGIELLKEAIALGCKEPIIMLTTENPEVDDEAMRLGAADFLNKEQLNASLLQRSIRYSMKHYATLQALRESEAQLASFMQNIPCAVYMKDLQGRYVYVNGTSEKLFKRPFNEWIGKTDDELWPRQIAARFKETDKKVLAGKVALETTETISQEDGRHYWLTTRFPILNEPGDPIMVGGAAIDITERKRLEEEIQHVSEQEKRRIGQDLHDGLGQYLTGISFMAKALQQKLAAKRSAEAAEAGKITDLVNRTVSQTRDLARGLCPVELENNGLHAALLDLTSSTEKLFGIKCTVESDRPLLVDDNAKAIHLYRIVQEAVNNAIKHGKAKAVSISFTSTPTTLTLAVADNGEGLPPGFSKAKGMGLRVMQYRAGMIGATVELRETQPRGATVLCVLPHEQRIDPEEDKSVVTKPIKRKTTARKQAA